MALTNQQPTGVWTNGFGYDAARRLTSVTSPAGTFAYLYTNVSGLRSAGSLVARIALPNTAYITNTFDASARLLSTRLNNSIHTALNAHGYQLNAANQRSQQTRTDGSTVTYTYDNLGQVIQALGSGGFSTENHGYGYDPAQNLNSRTNNGVTLFGVNNVNQLTTGPGGNYAYDANGNLTSESAGRTFTYDAENQLTSVTYGTYYRTELVYDGRMRLRVRKEFTWMYSGWYPNGETRYVYDGMRVIQERNSGNTPAVSYTRGNDLSGSLEGAGGIGGLLARSDQYSGGSFGRHVYYHADGNGNVTMLVDGGQASVATYRYDPFGRSLYAGGTLANANVYRFSSKELLGSSGLYYYGYRFYEPNLQRWVNRDPIAESGGVNLYTATGNSPLDHTDPSGLQGKLPRWPLPFPPPLPYPLPTWPGATRQQRIDQCISECRAFAQRIINATHDVYGHQNCRYRSRLARLVDRFSSATLEGSAHAAAAAFYLGCAQHCYLRILSPF